jgi:UDP-N-acetylmuramoyl-tripeptide--D-alanyl-D-alanine ligase
MGMCRRGQIAHQCRLLAPDVGVITNIGHAHLSGCGGFAGVVKAKSELVYGLKHGGVIVLNSDDYGTRRVNLSQFTGRIVWYGRAAKARYRLLNVSRYRGGIGFSVRAEGSTHYLYIPVLGERCVYDALAAASAARQVGMPWELIKRGLASYKSPRGRFTPLKGPHGALVIDDTFNANPLSVANGLRTLKEISYGRTTIAALGGMGEQGAGWRDVHWRVGRIAARLGIDQLLTVGGKARLIAAGALAAGMPRSRVHVFADQAGAARYLRPRLHSGMILLAKGSHVTHMKRLVRALIR